MQPNLGTTFVKYFLAYAMKKNLGLLFGVTSVRFPTATGGRTERIADRLFNLRE